MSGRKTTPLKELYLKIPNYIELTEEHKVIKYKVPTFHHQIRAHITDLVEKGEVKNVGYGIYAITPKGIERVKDLN